MRLTYVCVFVVSKKNNTTLKKQASATVRSSVVNLKQK